MRQTTAAERAVLASPHYVTRTRILIYDADGVERNLSARLESVEIQADIDQPIIQPRIHLHRDGDDGSLSPLVEDSPYNRIAGNVYSPLLDAGRRVQVLTACTLPDVAPVAGDWRLVFDGEIDDWEAHDETVQVVARDPGGTLQDRQIEEAQEYGTEAGVPLEAVMQALLDDTLGPGVVTLYVPESPGFMVTGYKPDEGPLLDALQACAQVIGWDVRYAWRQATGRFELTLIKPDRTKAAPDHTFGPTGYIDIAKLEASREGVRNVVQVRYHDTATGEVESVTVHDAASIGKYRRQFMRLVEDKGSPIDTAAEATTMATAALADLKDPKASHDIELRYWWPVELGDLYRFDPNDVYTTAQEFAVIGYRHRLTPGQQRTTIMTRGKPAGGYLTWIHRARGRARDGQDGADATAYWLITDAAAIKRSQAGAYTPPKITMSGHSATGEAAPTAYAGRFKVATLSGSTWTDRYTSGADEASHEYTVPAGVSAVRVRLYLAGGTTTLLDEEVVPVVEDGGVYAECQARVTSATATEITVTVDATPAGAQVELLASSTAVRATSGGGPNPGVKSPSGTVWKFQRPAALTNPTEARFRATLAGYESDDDHILIPEQGRDTVALLMRARVQSVTATQIVVRVAVADPVDPTRTGAITVTPSQVGTGGVAPSTAQTIAAANVRADLEATGYIDFTISRGAAGSGGGRVVFTATRTGRVADSDAVDVAELPPGVPVQALPPTATVYLEEVVGVSGRFRATGRDWQGGTAGLQYRYRSYPITQTPPPAFGAWAALASDGRSGIIAVTQHPRHTSRIDVQVRDAGQQESAIATATLDGAMEAIGPGGKLSPNVSPEGSNTPIGVSLQQAARPTQNLLGKWAGRYVTTAGAILGEESLAAMRLEPGHTISISTRIRRASGAGSPQLLIDWRAGVSVISTVTVTSATPEWARIGEAALVIPPGTTNIRLRVPPPTGGGTVEVGESTLTRGPLMMPFEEPPFRAARETRADLQGHQPSSVLIEDGVGPKVPIRGLQEYRQQHGLGVTFDTPFDDVPFALVIGPMAYSSTLGAGKTQYRREYAQDISASGIGKVIAELVDYSGVAQKTDTMQATEVSLEGQYREIPAGLSVTPTVPQFNVGYALRLEADAASDGFSEVNLQVTIAVDSKKGAEPYTERSARTYGVISRSGHRREDYSEAMDIYPSGLKLGDNIRVRIKKVVVTTRGAGGGYALGLAGGAVKYLTATEVAQEQTPPGSGQMARVIVFGVSS
jgi:hypothetical protein